MLLYHGSNKLFHQFKIKKELSNYNESSLMEGLGIYMTEDKHIAEGYGAYIYEVEIFDKDVLDSTDVEEMKSIIECISNKVNFDIKEMIDIDDLVLGVKEGEISVTKLYKEINDLLDSDERLYIEYSDRLTEDEDDLFYQIEKTYLEIIPPIIKYYDKCLGTVYICIREENKISIKDVISADIA